jgi:hypothetical protein
MREYKRENEKQAQINLLLGFLIHSLFEIDREVRWRVCWNRPGEKILDVALLPYVSCWHLALRYWKREKGGDGLITSTASVSYLNFQVSLRCGPARDMVEGKLFTWPDNIDARRAYSKSSSSFSAFIWYI